MPRKGRTAETIVQALERLFVATPDVEVQSPGFLADGVSGKMREFDVLIAARVGRHIMHTAIEVRDRKTPVSCEAIEAFQTKCADTRIAKKAFVSRSGYTKPALAKAKHYGIDCMNLTDASRQATSLLPYFVEVIRSPADCQLTLRFPSDYRELPAEWEQFRIETDNLTLSIQDLVNHVIQQFRQKLFEVPGRQYGSIADVTFNSPAMLVHTTERRPLLQMSIRFSYGVEWKPIEGKAYLYGQVHDDTVIAQAVVSAPTEILGQTTQIIVSWGSP